MNSCRIAFLLTLFLCKFNFTLSCFFSFYNLNVLFSGLTKELVKNCDGELKTQLISIAAEYEHRLTKGNKAIYHLEAFVAKFMAIYLEFMEDTMGAF